MFLASVIASIYYEEWEMYKLTFETFLIIGGGTTFFSFCCVLLNNRFTSKIKICPIVLHCSFFDCKRMIPFYVFVNAITLFSSYAKYSYLKSFFGSYSLLELLSAHHMDGHGESDALIVMPVIPRMAASFSQVVCFVSVWCLALMLYSKEKNRYLLLLICIHVILVTFDMMLSGSKGSMITMPISFLTIMTFFHYSKIGKFYIKKSFFVLIFLFLMCSATLFKGLSIIVGRDVEDRDAIELLAGYSGAEIKNLDIYLHNHPD
jgi:oligosaccharide repeat unit polymerase